MATAARIGISHELLPLPGDSITEALEEHALSVEVASEKLNVNPDYLEKVITGLSPISVALAKKLSRLLDIPESFWLNLQNDYDEALLALDKA